MRVGDSFVSEAAFTLRAPLATGAWGIVGDGILAGGDRSRCASRLGYDRKGTLSGDDSRDVVLAKVENTFVRNSSQPFSAVPFQRP